MTQPPTSAGIPEKSHNLTGGIAQAAFAFHLRQGRAAAAFKVNRCRGGDAGGKRHVALRRDMAAFANGAAPV
jgi:hypothetical protein